MADVAWFTRIDMFPRLGIPLERARHPHVVRWLAQLRGRAAVEQSLSHAEAKA